MFLKCFVILLIFGANCCLSHDAIHEQTSYGGDGGSGGVKGGRSGQGVKSYGGVFHDQGQNQNGHTVQYHQQPQFYQPYGWNFNQPQRTYGGTFQPNYQNNQQPQGFGWFGVHNQNQGNDYNRNNLGNNGQAPVSHAPSTPSLFLPNFVPPVYYPNTFPSYPNYNYPNYNLHPFAPPYNPNIQNGNEQFGGHGQNHFNNNNNDNGQNAGGNNGKNPESNMTNRPLNPVQALTTTTQSSINVNEVESQNRVDGKGDDKFLTNAFFGDNKEGTQNVNRDWTESDERKWQATTRAPYFENKIPGLDHCTLPASAVLGATTALKASSLLPLNIPIGKPILSCNATELLQAQINLQGIIYDCNRSSITMSCPRLDANHLVIDECQGETLECDVRMRQNTRSVSCTNGTLISNHPIICKSATLMETKNVLNCLYKGSADGTMQTPSVQTTPRSIGAPPQTSLIPPPPVHENNVDVDMRMKPDTPDTPLPTEGLHRELMHAIKYVFPHDLLSITAARQYLPPQSAAGQISDELKNQLDGVFPHELFSMSQTDQTNSAEQLVDNAPGLSLNRGENVSNRNEASFTENQRSQWDVSLNKKTGNSGTSFKTIPNRLSQRIGSEPGDDDDRLIFGP